MRMEFTLRMSSEEFGNEEFNYETLPEAQAGYQRILATIGDEIEREFEIVTIHPLTKPNSISKVSL